jgi:hypothetical protein
VKVLSNVPVGAPASLLCRPRTSGATRRPFGETNASQVGFGLRVSIIDEAEFRRRTEYRARATGLAQKCNDILLAVRRRVGPNVEMGCLPSLMSSDEREELEQLSAELKAAWEDRKWNADALDLALAARASGEVPRPALKVDKLSAGHLWAWIRLLGDSFY